MRKHIPFFLNNLTVWVLVAILTGCSGGEDGGSDQNQSATQKPDNAKGGQAAKGPEIPKAAEKPAEKFTREMVKAAMESALKQLSDSFPKEELAELRTKMLEPVELQELADELNENIVDGKIDDRGMKVDAITVEALTKAIVVLLPKAKREGDKKRVAVKIAFNSGYLARCLLDCSADNLEYTFPSSDKWCDAILRDARTLAVFYSPQHPDTPKLKESLPKPIPTKPEPAEPPAPTEESVEPAEPPALTEESVVGEPDPPAPVQEKPKPLTKGKQVSHYAMNKVMSGMDSTLDPEVILVFECDLGWNGAGGLEDALKYMDKFKLEKIAVATADGSTQFVTKEKLKKLKWVPLE